MTLEVRASRLKSRGQGLKNMAELKKPVIKGLPKYTPVKRIERMSWAEVEV